MIKAGGVFLSSVAVCVGISPLTCAAAADLCGQGAGLEEPGVTIVLHLLRRLRRGGGLISPFAFAALLRGSFGTPSCPGLQKARNKTPEMLKLGTCCQPGPRCTFCCRNCSNRSWLLPHPVRGGAGSIRQRRERMCGDELHHRPQR